MLTSGQLSTMRAAVVRMMPDTCYILAASGTVMPNGEAQQTWGTAGTTTCRMDHNSGKKAVAGGALQPFHGYVCTMPYNVTISTANRILFEGKTYTITSVDDAKSWDVTRRVYIEVLNG